MFKNLATKFGVLVIAAVLLLAAAPSHAALVY
jgi:hypothetical protein